MLEDEIDAAVTTPPIRVFVPKPNLLHLSGPFGVLGEEPLCKALELLAPLARIRRVTMSAIPRMKPVAETMVFFQFLLRSVSAKRIHRSILSPRLACFHRL